MDIFLLEKFWYGVHVLLCILKNSINSLQLCVLIEILVIKIGMILENLMYVGVCMLGCFLKIYLKSGELVQSLSQTPF